ncbi:hypothetical protein B0H10DRAFT_2220900 [Mycena sp. CBHHK59/15]|nr:hypothetical protein B0H10DRAFT_2220900 [Mycena sp. CBHHK59/15]
MSTTACGSHTVTPLRVSLPRKFASAGVSTWKPSVRSSTVSPSKSNVSSSPTARSKRLRSPDPARLGADLDPRYTRTGGRTRRETSSRASGCCTRVEEPLQGAEFGAQAIGAAQDARGGAALEADVEELGSFVVTDYLRVSREDRFVAHEHYFGRGFNCGQSIEGS